MITRQSALVFLFLPWLSACTTVQRVPLQSDATSSFQPGSRVIVTRYPIPSFYALTPSKAVFGLIGAGLSISEGNALIQQNKISDPAVVISEAMRSAMVDRYQMTAVPATTTILNDDSADAIAKTYAGSDFVVDVKTISWGYGYMPVNWDSYQVRYFARARLIHVKRGSVVAEDSCARSSKELSDAVSYQKLTENRSQFLRAKLAGYADSCAKELVKRMLKIDGTVVANSGPADTTAAASPEQKARPFAPAPQAATTLAAQSANSPSPRVQPEGEKSLPLVGSWTGKFVCGPFLGTGPANNPNGFQTDIKMDVARDGTVTATRGDKTFRDEVAGKLAGDMTLRLEGTGAYTDTARSGWISRYLGEFSLADAAYVFKGAGQIMNVARVASRDCTITAAKSGK